MIGIVVVSHSIQLAQAAVALSLEMVPGARPPIAIAAGAGEGILGTDATRVADAIDEVSGPSGVLVIMDLGSAVMSAEMALEFRSSNCEVILSRAPFVEGLLAAIVHASVGATLKSCALEAEGALEGKRLQLGEVVAAPMPLAHSAADSLVGEFKIVNPDGLHARPISIIVTTVQGFDATVTLSVRDKTVAAGSMMGVMSLAAKFGDVVTVAATGVQADEAFSRVRALFLDGFGELPSK